MTARRLAIGLAIGACVILAAMVALSAASGATQELHEWYRAPDAYAAGLVAHPAALRALFGLDLAFLTLYALFFTTLAQHLHRVAPSWLVWVGLGALLGTAVLDIVEDHHIVALLERALAGHPLDDDSIAAQHVISQTKFSLSYIGLVAFGLAIPRTRPIAWLLAAVLTAGTLATAIASLAAPADLRASLDAGRWVGFFLGFGLAALWLRRESD
ncbi:MAG TPA: hypothetical protein VGM88_03610 [Kofleriaceae bacterium]|jgi:hypothetical protein